MHVGTLYRYPVKSMLGEAVDALFVDELGVEGDRRLALIDEATGRVASAKQARLWRALLTCSASTQAGRVNVQLPDGTTVAAEADDIMQAPPQPWSASASMPRATDPTW